MYHYRNEKTVPLCVLRVHKDTETFPIHYPESHVIWVIFSFLFGPVWKETFSCPIDLLRPAPTVHQSKPPLYWLATELRTKFDSRG